MVISAATSSNNYQNASLSSGVVVNANKTITMAFVAKPQPSPSPTVAPSPTPSPTVAPTLPNWVDGLGTYTDGSRVVASDGNVYECNPYPYSGWCNQAGYDPTGIYGGQAWSLVGTPDNPAPTPVIDSRYPVWPNGIGDYKAGTIVNGYNGNLFQCRPWPYSGWCTQKAYNPYGLYGSQAWEPYNPQ